MTSAESENPYLSPRLGPPIEAPLQRLRPSMWRGLLYAVLYAFLGLIVAHLLVAPLVFAEFMEGRLFRSEVIGEILEKSRYPATGCAIVFSLAALLNYTPAKRMGMLRSLACVGFAAIAGFFLNAIVSPLLGIQLRRGDDPWEHVRFALVFAVPLGYALVHTLKRVARRSDEVDEGITFIEPTRHE